MNEPKTPNLGLNKMDRSSPSTTYFDLDKYLDQNWEKVDGFADQVEERAVETAGRVSSIQERLDTEKRKAVTLEPGLQVVNAERASAFNLEGLKGRTLVNLLGRRGNGESLSGLPVATNSAIIALDSTTKDLGASSFKITSTGSGSTEHYVDLAVLDVLVGACYVLVAMAKPNAKANGRLMTYGIVDESPSDFFPESNLASATDRYTPVFLKFNPVTAKKVMVRLQVPNSSKNVLYVPDGQEVNFDSIRLYRITSEEYHGLSNMTPEQVNSKYPYVDSVQPVRNPYVIRYGENLIPPFYEWGDGALAGTTTIENPYQIKMFKARGSSGFNTLVCKSNAAPLTDYTLSVKVDMSEIGGKISAGAYWNAGAYAADGSFIEDFTQGPFVTTNGTQTMVRSFKTPANTKYVRVVIGLDNGTTGTAVFRDVRLNIGDTAQSFKPREDAMLALQTYLNADPVTGANADEVFEKDGQYLKLAKWRDFALDGSKSWSNGEAAPTTGLKQVKAAGLAPNAVAGSGIVTKFDGKLVPQGSTGSLSDRNAVTGLGDVYVSIPSIDSGWGDSYRPEVDEIKAYFMGWKMYTFAQPVDGSYDGTGTKAWVEIPWKDRNNDTNIRQHVTYTLPTAQAPSYMPYQLLHQLATPVFEPITSEGQLTFIERDNQIEVGTGIVLRELVMPKINTIGDFYTINTAGGDTITALNNKVDRFIGVYRNSKLDAQWVDNTFQPYGRVRKVIPTAKFDPSASYTATYLMLDASSVAPFVGSVADNEKALFTDLVQDVQQANARLSVVESKKAEKDAPAWIAPTLLSGSINYDTTQFASAGYYKDSQGLVHFRGLLKMAGATVGTPLFILLPGYRPNRRIVLSTIGGNGSGGVNLVRIDVFPNGTVQMTQGVAANDMLSLDELPLYQAEQ